MSTKSKRSINTLGASFIGIGAIVGGGVFVLGGVAVEAAGAGGAILALIFNGLIGFLTIASFSELSGAFPESGGVYTYAKRVLSLRSAFAVGWVLWLAHVATAGLYALGFSAYANQAIISFFPDFNSSGQPIETYISLIAILIYSKILLSQQGGGKNFVNMAKLVIFSVVLLLGFISFLGQDSTAVSNRLSPFMPMGVVGVLSAMGFTFIVLQGFDLIPSVAGEIKEPARTIPKAMSISLLIGLLIYVPLLFFAVTSDAPDSLSSKVLCKISPDTCVADLVKNFSGSFGYWLVVFGAMFGTLTAMSANLLVSSRIAHTMASDRTLPRVLSKLEGNVPTIATAVNAALASLFVVVAIDAATAGASASLVFLVLFSLMHGICVLARKRNISSSSGFPYIQILGGVACLGLAIFQGVIVPISAIIILAWLVLGVLLYYVLFSARAEALDAYAQAINPELLKFRGHSPFVLVPITNPDNSPSLVRLAHAIASPATGRVMLLNVVRQSGDDDIENRVAASHDVLSKALTTSMKAAYRSPQTLLTVADDPWKEIYEVSKAHNCESLVLGFNQNSEAASAKPLEKLLNQVDANVLILSACPGFNLKDVKRVLVPTGGRRDHDSLRARVLGVLISAGVEEVTLLRLLPEFSSNFQVEDARQKLSIRAQDEASGFASVDVKRTSDVGETIVSTAKDYDLVVLGLNVETKKTFHFGSITTTIASKAPCATLMIKS